MKTRIVLGSVSYSATGVDQVYFRGLPTKGVSGRTARVTKLEFENNLSVTTGGGAVVSSQALHDLVTYNADDGASPWGPVQQKGSRLSALYYRQTGEAIPFAESANGDSDVQPNAVAASRIFREFYDFEKMAPKETPFSYCPPCSALKGGSVQFTFSALPTNASAITGTITVYAHIAWVNDQTEDTITVTVPRIRTVSQAFVGTGMDLTIAGLMLRAFAFSSLNGNGAGVAVSLADWTTFQVYADGFPIMLDHNPIGRTGTAYDQTPAVAASALQSTFSDSIGGALPFTLPLFPIDPRENLESLVSAETFNVQFTGTAATANYTWISTYVVEVTDADVEQQASACGCGPEMQPASAVSVPIHGNRPLPQGSHLGGFTPIATVTHGSVLSKAHTLVHKMPPALSINGVRHAIGSSIKGAGNTMRAFATSPGSAAKAAYNANNSGKKIIKRLGF